MLSFLSRRGVHLTGLIALVFVLSAGAQAPEPSVDQQAYQRFLRWVSGLPLDVRGSGGFSEQQSNPTLVKMYRAYLRNEGFKDADIDSQIELLHQRTQQLDAERWDKYFAAEHPAFNTHPNGFLIDMVKGRQPGKALDVAMGQGRNSIWLAQQGWDVSGFDIAEQAMTSANQQAAKLGVKIHTEVNTIEGFDYGESRWDLILLSYAGDGPPPAIVERALKPGGILIVEAFHEDALKSLRIGGSLFKTGLLPGRYPGLRTVRYEEPIAMPDFAPKPARVVRFCALKPEAN
jgi:protein-L-isoaspartate O-methyltransferase